MVITFYIYLKPRLTRPQSAEGQHRPFTSHVTHFSTLRYSELGPIPFIQSLVRLWAAAQSPDFLLLSCVISPVGLAGRAWGWVGRQLRPLKVIFAAEARNVRILAPACQVTFRRRGLSHAVTRGVSEW